MLEVLGEGEQKEDVFVAGLLDLRKEKMDGALTLRGHPEGDWGLTGTAEVSGSSTAMGSECCISTESSHVTRLTLLPFTQGSSFFDVFSGLFENVFPSLGLEVSE